MIGRSGSASAIELIVWVARAIGSSMLSTTISGFLSLTIVTASMPYPASPETLKLLIARARDVSARPFTSGSTTTMSRFFWQRAGLLSSLIASLATNAGTDSGCFWGKMSGSIK